MHSSGKAYYTAASSLDYKLVEYRQVMYGVLQVFSIMLCNSYDTQHLVTTITNMDVMSIQCMFLF